MRVEEALALLDELKPNQYDDAVKISWLSKLDFKIYEEVIKRYEPEKEEEKEEEKEVDISRYIDDGTDPDNPDDENHDPELPDDVPDRIPDEDEEEENNIEIFNGYTQDDMSTQLIVCDAYADLYIDYLFAQIDYVNQELDRYSNSMAMFNSKYAAYKNYYNRTHTPIKVQYKLF